MATNDGGPAFPMPSGDEPRVNTTTHYNEGMSLLDWFAGQVISGLVGSPDWKYVTTSSKDADECMKLSAKFAFGVAEYMLAEKQRRSESAAS